MNILKKRNRDKIMRRFKRRGSLFLLVMIPLYSRAGAFGNLNGINYGTPVVVKQKIDAIKTIAVLPIDFDYFHLTAGGIREYDDSLSTIAKNLILSGVNDRLRKNGYSVKVLASDSSSREKWESILRFYEVINYTIKNCIYGYDALPDAWMRFSYSLPPLKTLCGADSVDAVLFIDGYDEKQTDRRVRLRAGAAAGAVAGAVLAAVVGVGYSGVTIREDMSSLSCALVNMDGEIVWYNMCEKTCSSNFAIDKDVRYFLVDLLNELKKAPEINEKK